MRLLELPRAACQLTLERLELAMTDADVSGKIPVTILARTLQPVSSYFGPVHHDFDGMQYHLPLPLDYCHDDTEVVGFIEALTVSTAGLMASGFLVSVQPQDRAAEIAQKRKAGVPYQASIFLEPLAVEEVQAASTTNVNGQTISGPALVVRQWRLRGIAICPYGRDPHTRTDVALAARRSGTCSVPVLEFRTMDQRPESPSSAPEDLRAEFAAQLARYVQAFGPERGAAWVAEGLTWDQALERQCQLLQRRCAELESQAKQQQEALEQQIAQLKAQLSAAPRGEEEPVSFSAEPSATAQQAEQLYPGLGKLAVFAASLKLPRSQRTVMDA